MTNASANSIMPRLMPCSSSPALGSIKTKKKSTMAATSYSLWPTPTVSTRITSKPAASHSNMVSRVFCATPPKAPSDGLGRIYAFCSRLNNSMRVLSPRILPPLNGELGSTANTATFLPWLIRCKPNASINVDLPTPGIPVIPIRILLPVLGKSWLSNVCACSR